MYAYTMYLKVNKEKFEKEYPEYQYEWAEKAIDDAAAAAGLPKVADHTYATNNEEAYYNSYMVFLSFVRQQTWLIQNIEKWTGTSPEDGEEDLLAMYKKDFKYQLYRGD